MRIWLLILLLSIRAVWCCIANEYRCYHSRDGSWRYEVFWDDGFRHEVKHGKQVVWSRHLGHLPFAGAISDDGCWSAFWDERHVLHLLDAQGRQVRRQSFSDPRLLYGHILLWFEGDRLWLQTQRGLLYSAEMPGVPMQEATVQQAFQLGLHPAQAVRLAIQHGLPLPNATLQEAARCQDPETREALAAWKVLHGDRSARAQLRPSGLWRAVLEGPRIQDTSYEMVIISGVFRERGEFSKRLEQGDEDAAFILGQIGTRATVPALWRALDRGNAKAVGALSQILGAEISPALAQRLGKSGPDQLALLDYFRQVPYPEVVPRLLEYKFNDYVRAALIFQTRRDLGADPKAWREWWEARGKSTRWTRPGDPDACLWSAMQGQDPTPLLKGSARLVQLFPAKGADDIGFQGRQLRVLRGRNVEMERGWDWWNGNVLETALPGGDRVGFATSRDGKTLLLADSKGIQRLAPGPTQHLVSEESSLELSPSGKWLYCTYPKSTLIQVATGQRREVSTAYFGGKFIFDAQERYLWCEPPLALGSSMPLPPKKGAYRTDSPALSPDGTRLVQDQSLYFLEGKPRCLNVPEGAVVWSPTSDFFFVETGFDSVTLYTRDGKLLQMWPSDCATFSPDGRRLAFVTGEKVVVWSLASQAQVATIPNSSWVQKLAFSQDSRFLAVLDVDRIAVWEIEGRQSLA